MKIFRFKTQVDIKSNLRRGDYALIAEILKGRYTERTVESQLTGQRTLKEPVIEAANRLIEYREQLLNQTI